MQSLLRTYRRQTRRFCPQASWQAAVHEPRSIVPHFWRKLVPGRSEIRAIGDRLENLDGAIGSEGANTGAAKSYLAELTVRAAKEIKPEMPD